jgi:type IV secretion system protein VirB10
VVPEERDRLPAPPRDTIRDERVKPRGVLPRHIQTWAMVAVAGAMLLVILITGRPNAPRRPADATAPSAAASTLPPDRLRRYQEQLTEQEARLRRELADAQAAAAASPQAPASAPGTVPADPIAEERRRREYASLFAESVAFTRRSAGTATPTAAARPRSDADSALTEAMTRAAIAAAEAPPSRPAAVVQSPPVGVAPEPTIRTPNSEHSGPLAPIAPEPPADGRKRLLEGTVIEAVLTNRLEGSFSNPVNALVTTPVYVPDRQTVVIPAGARILGTAAPVQALGETRLAVKFHRLVMPDGVTYDLDQFPGLNERGDAGLKDQVDRHYLQIFGASIALGSLSGLSQYATRSASSADYGFSDAFGQGMGASLATSSARVLDRFLNVLPGVTIREGHRLRIYLTRDLDLPPYREQPAR